MNKSVYIIYNLVSQIKKRHDLYTKYGYLNHILPKSAIDSSDSLEKSFVLSKSHSEETSLSMFPKNEVSQSENLQTLNSSSDSKYTSFLSLNSSTDLPLSSESSDFLRIGSYSTSFDKGESPSSSIQEGGLTIQGHQYLQSSLKEKIFTYETSVSSLSESDSSSQSFKMPRDFTTDFRNLEDWNLIQNRPYDALVRENYLDLAKGSKTDDSSELNEPSLKVGSNRFDWSLDSFCNLYKSKKTGLDVKLNEEQVFSKNSEPESSFSEFHSLVENQDPKDVDHEGSFVEQVISGDIQTAYKDRLQVEKRLRWFYGLSTKSSFNRAIFPFDTKRSLNSKKSMGTGLLEKLEGRLDVQVFRLQWASTIQAARQLIQHGHILVWSEKDYSMKLASILKGPRKKTSSYCLQAKDLILLKPKSLNSLDGVYNCEFHSRSVGLPTNPLTENKTNEALSFKFPWSSFYDSLDLKSGSESENPMHLLQSAEVLLTFSPSLGDKLIDSVESSNGKFRSMNSEVVNKPLHKMSANYVQLHSESAFYVYEGSRDLSSLPFPQLDLNELKSFLLSHN